MASGLFHTCKLDESISTVKGVLSILIWSFFVILPKFLYLIKTV